MVDAGLLLFDAGASLDRLAGAYSISVVVAAGVGGALAFRRTAVRPRAFDLLTLLLALAAMVAAVLPFNGLATPWLAALAGVSLGGAIYLSVLLAFDFAGMRGFLFARLRARRGALA